MPGQMDCPITQGVCEGISGCPLALQGVIADCPYFGLSAGVIYSVFNDRGGRCERPYAIIGTENCFENFLWENAATRRFGEQPLWCENSRKLGESFGGVFLSRTRLAKPITDSLDD